MLKTPSTGSTLNDVLIIGAGIVGLTLAQGLREAGIPFQIFEKLDASDPASQGWGLTLHWSLNALERTIGPQLFALLPEVGDIRGARAVYTLTHSCRDKRRS